MDENNNILHCPHFHSDDDDQTMMETRRQSTQGSHGSEMLHHLHSVLCHRRDNLMKADF